MKFESSPLPDIDIASIEDFRRRCFGPASQLDEAEPSDGDECVHYIVIEPPGATSSALTT